MGPHPRTAMSAPLQPARPVVGMPVGLPTCHPQYLSPLPTLAARRPPSRTPSSAPPAWAPRALRRLWRPRAWAAPRRAARPSPARRRRPSGGGAARRTTRTRTQRWAALLPAGARGLGRLPARPVSAAPPPRALPRQEGERNLQAESPPCYGPPAGSTCSSQALLAPPLSPPSPNPPTTTPYHPPINTHSQRPPIPTPTQPPPHTCRRTSSTRRASCALPAGAGSRRRTGQVRRQPAGARLPPARLRPAGSG